MKGVGLMDGIKTTRVDYDVISQCLDVIKEARQDYQTTIMIANLQKEISESKGNYSSKLLLVAQEVKDTYNIVMNLVNESIKVLELAQKMFADADEDMTKVVEG